MNVQTTVQKLFSSPRMLTWAGFVVALLIFGGYAVLLQYKELSTQELLRSEIRYLRQENQLLLDQNQQLEASCSKMATKSDDHGNAPPVAGDIPGNIEGARERSFVYTVKKGDTIWDIAAMYQIDVNDLMRWNLLTSRSRIFPGDQLTIILEE